jgi:hypothetical protein
MIFSLALSSLVGCSDPTGILLHFDGPIAAAVIPGGASVFDDPVGVVANQRSGSIVPVDLKSGRLLTLSEAASFLRTPALATGVDRLLGDVEVNVAADGSTMVWATDTAHSSVVRIPWYGVDDEGQPVLQPAVAGGSGFNDVDGSGDDAALFDVGVRDGFTTTEDWSVSYDGARWWVEGSASGPQTKEPAPDVAYWTDHGELGFTLSGAATAGDRFDIRTDTGLVEIPTDAIVADLLIADGVVYGSYSDTTGSGLWAWNAVTGAALPGVRFESGSGAGRMVYADVEGVPTLFVSDTRLSQVHRVYLDTLEVGVPVAAAAAVLDVAVSSGVDEAGVSFSHLFIAPLGLLRVDVYDLYADLPVDPNPITPEIEGVFLGSPVSGLAASIGSVWQQRETTWGARPRVPAVAVSTGDGYVFQLDGSTGCAVVDLRGPHGPNQIWDTTVSYASLNDLGATSDVSLWIDSYSGEQASFSTCGGVTVTETWTITFDSASATWTVDGSHSGPQQGRAQSDVRYLSDTGAVSFLIVSGARPATDGDQFLLSVDSGLLTVKGIDTNQDTTTDAALVFPGRPAAFEYFAGPTGGGWDDTERREGMLLPLTDADAAARIDLDAGRSEVRWQ